CINRFSYFDFPLSPSMAMMAPSSAWLSAPIAGCWRPAAPTTSGLDLDAGKEDWLFQTRRSLPCRRRSTGGLQPRRAGSWPAPPRSGVHVRDLSTRQTVYLAMPKVIIALPLLTGGDSGLPVDYFRSESRIRSAS